MNLNQNVTVEKKPYDFFDLWIKALLARNLDLAILQTGEHNCFFSFVNDKVIVNYEEPETKQFRILELGVTDQLEIVWLSPSSAFAGCHGVIHTNVKRGDPQGNGWNLSYTVKKDTVHDVVLKPMNAEVLKEMNFSKVESIGRMKLGGRQ